MAAAGLVLYSSVSLCGSAWFMGGQAGVGAMYTLSRVHAVLQKNFTPESTMRLPTITTDRLVLRAPGPADLPSFLAYHTCNKTNRGQFCQSLIFELFCKPKVPKWRIGRTDPEVAKLQRFIGRVHKAGPVAAPVRGWAGRHVVRENFPGRSRIFPGCAPTRDSQGRT